MFLLQKIVGEVADHCIDLVALGILIISFKCVSFVTVFIIFFYKFFIELKQVIYLCETIQGQLLLHFLPTES